MGDQTSDVRYAGEAVDSPCGLYWGEIENYGTDTEVSGYLLNRDVTCDYGEIIDPIAIEVYKVPGRGFNSHAPGRKGAYFQSIQRQNERSARGEMVSSK